MRLFFAIAWLFVGLGLVIYHFGPGEKQRELDHIDSIISQANQITLVQAKKDSALQDYSKAIDLYDEALAIMPTDREKDSLVIRLEKAKLQMLSRKLPQARESLEGLLEEVESCEEATDEFENDVRATLANAQYYNTWLMRLEGKPKSDWETEIESARQNYRLLLEKAEAGSDKDQVETRKEDLESAVRLARLDISELQALPLPCQCKGCCSCNCKGVSKKKAKKPKGSGASFGKPGDGDGS